MTQDRESRVGGLMADVDAEIDSARRISRVCNWTLTVISFLGFAASAVATMLAASKSTRTELLTIMAAIPALVTGANSSFSLSKRVAWHNHRALLFIELRDRMRLDMISPEEAVAQKAAILKALDGNWKWEEMVIPKVEFPPATPRGAAAKPDAAKPDAVPAQGAGS